MRTSQNQCQAVPCTNLMGLPVICNLITLVRSQTHNPLHEVKQSVIYLHPLGVLPTTWMEEALSSPLSSLFAAARAMRVPAWRKEGGRRKEGGGGGKKLVKNRDAAAIVLGRIRFQENCDSNSLMIFTQWSGQILCGHFSMTGNSAARRQFPATL